jgi:hypothetical protein
MPKCRPSQAPESIKMEIDLFYENVPAITIS